MDDDDEDEDEDEEGDEDGEGEDRSHGLSVCSFDVLSPHCSPLCILYLSYYTLCTVLPPAGTTLHFKLYHTLYYTIVYYTHLCCGQDCKLYTSQYTHSA